MSILATNEKNLRSEKRTLRKAIRLQRKLLSEKERNDAAELALQRLRAFPPFAKARRVAMYASMADEFPMKEIFHCCLSLGKKVFFPVVTEEDLVFQRVKTWESLTPSAKGIPEPLFGEELFSPAVDLIIVPFLAADRFGNRLGQGGGFYDRYLSRFDRPRVVLGIGFDFQLIEKVPFGSRDQRLEFILTEKRLIRV